MFPKTNTTEDLKHSKRTRGFNFPSPSLTSLRKFWYSSLLTTFSSPSSAAMQQWYNSRISEPRKKSLKQQQLKINKHMEKAHHICLEFFQDFLLHKKELSSTHINISSFFRIMLSHLSGMQYKGDWGAQHQSLLGLGMLSPRRS